MDGWNRLGIIRLIIVKMLKMFGVMKIKLPPSFKTRLNSAKTEPGWRKCSKTMLDTTISIEASFKGRYPRFEQMPMSMGSFFITYSNTASIPIRVACVQPRITLRWPHPASRVLFPLATVCSSNSLMIVCLSLGSG